jgi:phage-related protein
MTMQDKQNAGVGGFIDDLNGAIRENPLAAGLVGAGVLWMFMGGNRLSAFGKALPGAAGAVTNAVGAAAGATGSTVAEAFTATASKVSEAARQVGSAISSGSQDAAATAKHAASAGYDAVRTAGASAGESLARSSEQARRSSSEFGREFGMSVQQNLTETLERQPLLLGAIGLAVGAGIASAFPSTKIEQEMMGEAGAAVKDKIQEFAGNASEFASQRAREVFDEVKKEAGAQGLAPDALTSSVKNVAQKVGAAASASRDSIKDRLS